jgi:hypothetical protein
MLYFYFNNECGCNLITKQVLFKFIIVYQTLKYLKFGFVLRTTHLEQPNVE